MIQDDDVKDILPRRQDLATHRGFFIFLHMKINSDSLKVSIR